MLKGYKTTIFNAVMGVIMLFQVIKPDAPVPGSEEVSSTLDTLLEHADAIITVAGNIWLRFVTTAPVFNKT